MTKVERLPLPITLILAACAALSCGNAISLWATLTDLERSTALEKHTWEVITALHEVKAMLVDAETGQRGYLLTADRSYLEPFLTAETRLATSTVELERLIADNTVQVRRAAQLRELVTRRVDVMRDTNRRYDEEQNRDALRVVRAGEGLRIMTDARAIIDQMVATERDLLVDRSSHSYRQSRLATTASYLIGLVTLLALLLLSVNVRRNIARRLAAEHALQATNELLEARVKHRTEQLSHLAGYLLKIGETEKAALAQELHDELGANLTAINLDISSVKGRLKVREPQLAQKLERALLSLRETVELKRRIIHGLRPSMLDSLGISATMRMHCEDFTRRTGLPCRADIAEDLGSIDPAATIALYRIAQEALNNVAKYAKARHVRIRLQRDATGIRLQVIDDGIGIPPNAMHMPLAHGLIGMRERMVQLGGSFDARTGEHGTGTVVEAFLPLSPIAQSV